MKGNYNAVVNTELTYGSSSNGYSGYDRFGGIAATLWKSGANVLVESQYGRNAVGGVVWRKDVKAHAMSVTTQDNFYGYDGLHQVTRHDRGNLTPGSGPPYTGIDPTTRQQQEDFTYDETGNWLGYQSQSPSLVQSRTHNVANQITDITNPSGVIDPIYDATGNMTTLPSPANWTIGYTAKWDAWNRLVELKQGTTVVGTYTYDALTRRIQKTTPSETRDYYYDRQWRALEERVSGTIKADYVYNPYDRWDLIRRRRSVSSTLDESRYVLRDYLDPVAIVDTTGTVTERYGYDAFGPARIMEPDFEDRSASVCDWEWLFHGEFIDRESGLYNYGYRYYHPQLGRWLSEDPLLLDFSVMSNYDKDISSNRVESQCHLVGLTGDSDLMCLAKKIEAVVNDWFGDGNRVTRWKLIRRYSISGVSMYEFINNRPMCEREWFGLAPSLGYSGGLSALAGVGFEISITQSVRLEIPCFCVTVTATPKAGGFSAVSASLGVGFSSDLQEGLSVSHGGGIQGGVGAGGGGFLEYDSSGAISGGGSRWGPTFGFEVAARKSHSCTRCGNHPLSANLKALAECADELIDSF